VCAVCKVTYDFILQFEWLDDEEAMMLETLGLRAAFPPVALNREAQAGEPGVAATYLAMLDREDWAALVRLYARDAAMFGYTGAVEALAEELERGWVDSDTVFL
jgi:hypothetical protein